MARELITFGVDADSSITDEELNDLFSQCHKANRAIEDLVNGNLSVDDCLALCESYGANADDVILNMNFKLEYLGLI